MNRIHWQTLFPLLILVGCSAAASGQQETTSWTGGNGNWFDKEKWTLRIPGQSTVANISNGAVEVGPNNPIPTAFGLEIARFNDNGFRQGSLSVNGRDLFLTANLTVAETSIGSVEGILETSGNGQSGGTAFVNDVSIGVVTGKGGEAHGTVKLDGDLNTNDPRQRTLIVGQNRGSGFANGLLDVQGDIGTVEFGFSNVLIGHFQGTDGEAIGHVNARSLNYAGGQLNVGLNTASNPFSLASGMLTTAEINGFERAHFGNSEAGRAEAVVSVASFYNVTHTELGSKNGRGTATMNLGRDAKYIGDSLLVNKGSHIAMGRTMDVNFTNSGRASIQDLPDGRNGGRTIMSNTYTQTPSGVLELDIDGPLRGGGYESIQVADGAFLEGRIQLNFSPNFQPQVGHQFDFVTTGGQFSAKDIQWTVRNPPQDLAVRFPESNGLSAVLVEPRPLAFVNAVGSQFQWTDADIWSNKESPQSFEDIALVNARAEKQTVFATRGAMARSLVVDGNTNEMSLIIPADTSLTATHGIEVKSNGEIVLDRGALLANSLDINPGGKLQGDGSFVGELVNQGFVGIGNQPEPSTLNVAGGFTQLSQGWLEMDVFGSEPGAFDQIIVDGPVTLNGTLNLNIRDLGDLAAGTEIPLIQASEGISGDLRLKYDFADADIALGLVPRFGPDSGGMQMMLISGGAGILGDMNWDGSVDECDLDSFALGLQDVDTYTDFHIFEPSYTGDINDDSEFDVDDIQPFFDLVNGVPCKEIEAIPEPASNLLGIFAIITFFSLRIRRMELNQNV